MPVCLVLLALGRHPDLPIVLAANRDEYHDRPSTVAQAWIDLPHVVGGRDLEKQGTWLAAATPGAFAVVTNYRDPSRRLPDARSRGFLVRDFVADPDATAEGFLRRHLTEGDAYDGFNLIAGDASGVWYGSNRGGLKRLDRGLFGLSNHLLDTPWPKVARAKSHMKALLSSGSGDLEEALFGLLGDRHVVPDAELPATGVPLEWERRLSPPFIVSPDYGTRCSTVLTIDVDNRLRLVERSFARDGSTVGTVAHVMMLERPLGSPYRT